jgi:hypothetical protein
MTMRLLLRSALCGAFLFGAAFAQISQPGGGGTGSGTVSGTINTIGKFTSSTAIGDSLFTDDGTTATYTGTGGVSAKKFTILQNGSEGGSWDCTDGTTPASGPAAGHSFLYCDSTARKLKASFNNGSYVTMATTSGTLTSGNCAKFDASGNLVDNGATCGGSSIGTVFGFYAGALVTASTTTYCPIIGGTVGGSGACSTTEADRATVIPVSCTAKNIYIYLGSAQPGTGTLVLTLRKGATAAGMADTLLTKTIAAGAAAGPYSATIDASLSAGDFVGIKITNNATSGSGSVYSYTIQCQ